MGKNKSEKDKISILRTQFCSFSGYKIQPGRGTLFVQNNGKKRVFLNSKCQAHFRQGKKPREVRWTILYRRFRKKDHHQDLMFKSNMHLVPRTRRTQKFHRGIAGHSEAELLARRNMKPELREELVRAAKEKVRARAKSVASESGAKGQGPGAKGQGSGAKGQGPGAKRQGPGAKGQGSGAKGQGSGAKGQGSGAKGQGPGAKTDAQKARVSFGQRQEGQRGPNQQPKKKVSKASSYAQKK